MGYFFHIFFKHNSAHQPREQHHKNSSGRLTMTTLAKLVQFYSGDYFQRPLFQRFRDFSLANRRFRSTSAESLTRVSQQSGLLRITLCNPEQRNVLSLEVLKSLFDEISGPKDDPSLRAILIDHEGPVFSMGHDLGVLMEDEADVLLKNSMLLGTIRTVPVPVLTAVRGLAAAAGCNLVALSDIAICSETSSFSMPRANFDVLCMSSSVGLVRAVPRQLGNLMLYTGEPIDAHTAFRAGLVAKVVPEEELEGEVDRVVTAIMGKPRDVVTLGKRFLDRSRSKWMSTAAYRMYAAERDMYYAKAGEGLKSLADKKNPKLNESP